MQDPFVRLVRDKRMLESAQLKNSLRFDDDMYAEIEDDSGLSMIVEVGGYANATKGARLPALITCTHTYTHTYIHIHVHIHVHTGVLTCVQLYLCA